MITILCSGSRGDIQPYIAIAKELKALGKEVRIAAGQSFRDFIEGCGISCYPLSADYHTAELDPKLLEAAGSSTSPFKMLLTFHKMKKYARLLVDEMYDACQDSEVIVYHPGCTMGYYAAEKMGIPSVLASPFPMHQTSEVQSVIAYGKSKMSAKMSYRMLQGMLFMASKNGVASYWKEMFGTLPDPFDCPFERVDASHPSIISCSNYIFPRPSDWNPHIHQYGYWLSEEEETQTIPKELASFLEKGDKPIYFGFGSVFQEKEKAFFLQTICEALAAVKKRGILCGMGEVTDLPETIMTVGSVSHRYLFPRCAAVCHHGGTGTSAAGFAAGVPSIIIPFSNDQFAWAHRSYDLGVGSYPIYKKKLTADRLAEAIRFALTGQVCTKAKRLGESISTEHGARDCAEVIFKLTAQNQCRQFTV